MFCAVDHQQSELRKDKMSFFIQGNCSYERSWKFVLLSHVAQHRFSGHSLPDSDSAIWNVNNFEEIEVTLRAFEMHAADYLLAKAH